MKIDYISDLHINHHVFFKPDQVKWEKNTREWTKELLKTKAGEILLVAGDFSEWNKQALWFLEEASLVYNQVYFVTGNHDYYLLSKRQKEKYKDSKGRQRELLEEAAKIPGVTPLCRQVVDYKGIKIAGDSLWYLPESEKDWMFFTEMSNDSRYISILEAQTFYNVSKREEVAYLHQEAMDWYQSLEGTGIDIMMSHIPPLHPPISPHAPNGCYHVTVPFLSAKHWVCGHQHVQGVFEKAGTTFYMNTMGYPDEGLPMKINTLEL